ncbi:MAG: hypothetical protein KC438_15265 [Thermomicrobiales bacterium]|nr:hypothetical protein [Thermomicrobiales bacterium]MCO5222835.1 hypothetical protein [Thermomicrobiales bacterium]
MRRLLRDQGLTLVTLGLFLLMLSAQALTGFRVYNAERTELGEPEIAFAGYLRSGHFAEATFENWESEFLQMGAYVLLTAFLIQRGSAESRDPDASKNEQDAEPVTADSPWPVRTGGWVLKIYENSLPIALFGIFAVSFLLHAWGGARVYSEEQVAQGGHAYSTWQYLQTAQFWFESFQNWQSEFLAVGSLVVLSIFLRQRGSPESKPVAAPHSSTGA